MHPFQTKIISSVHVYEDVLILNLTVKNETCPLYVVTKMIYFIEKLTCNMAEKQTDKWNSSSALSGRPRKASVLFDENLSF